MWTEPNPKASCERHWLFSQLLEKGEGGEKHTEKLPATRPHQHRGQRAFGVQGSEALEGWGPRDRHISAAEIDQSERSVSQGAQGKVPSCEMTSFILSAYRGAGEIGLPGRDPSQLQSDFCSLDPEGGHFPLLLLLGASRAGAPPEFHRPKAVPGPR